MKVLIVDDEPQIRRTLGLNLSARGHDIVEAETGERGLTAVASERPDVVLLDLGLSGMDGLMVIEALRRWTNVPIIVLTARDDERSKVFALDLGADDYVTKPFGMAELLARIRAVGRRLGGDEPDAPEVVTDDFRLDLAGRRAFAGRERAETRLTPIEWSIVIHLVRHAGRLVTYRQLAEAVWGGGYQPDHNLLRVHMGHIRHKLEPNPSRPRYFVTDSGTGFRFQND